MRSGDSIDKKSMDAEMNLILKSVNSMCRTNRSSIDKSPKRSSIDRVKKKKLVSSLRNSRKLYHHQIKEEKSVEKEESDFSLNLDLSLDQEYTMMKCNNCFMYFVQKELANHVKGCK